MIKKFIALLLMITVSAGIFIPKFNNIVNGVNHCVVAVVANKIDC